MCRFFLLFALLLGSCSSACKMNYCVEGAQEFVLDSYKIREGKFSILELEGECHECLPPEYLLEYVDRIDEDDILRVALFHPTREDLTIAINSIGSNVGFRVVQGAIHVPGLIPVHVKGLTLDEARNKLQNLYDNEISHTEVFLEYGERLHSKVELAGAVGVPSIPVNGRIRLYEVLSIAKVPPSANLFKSYVLRNNIILPIDLHKLLSEGDMSQNIVMQPKDKIYIADPMAATVMVMGEINLAQLIPVPKGYISLREAIAAAGGIPFTGDRRSIQIIRGNIVCPKIYRVSWNHIAFLPNDSLLLMPGDIVYISEKPITKWNRFIEQLLPTNVLFDIGVKTRGVFH